MTSVWKRIQRVGKRASKFQFIASYQTLTLECSRDGKWQPNKLSVIWTRRNRRKAVKPETWQPSIANPFRGMIVWTDPEEVEISVTLYKDAREGSPFEDKLWTFVIEDESSSGKRRPVASVSINMVDYHSVDLQTFCLNLPLRPASKKVVSASLELNLACVLLKEGNATDEDMISMSSLLSLNDPYGSREFDHDYGKNFKRNAGKRLSLRSAKSKNKPTFNMATNTASPKESKKNGKNKGKSSKNEVNKTLPVTNHVATKGLNKPLSTSDTDLSKMDSRASPEMKKKEEQMSAPEKTLLKWCQECVEGYPNVELTNMTTSWRNGLAFCAIIHHFKPEMIDFSNLKPDDVRENNRLAFEAFDYLGISRMLDPHQMVLSAVPDKLLIMTYLYQIKQYFTTRKTTADDHDNDLTMATIAEAERSLRLNTETLINDVENNDFTKVKSRETEPKTDASKGVITDTSDGDRGRVEYEIKTGYNPFDEEETIAEEEDIDIGFIEESFEAENGKTKSADKLQSKESKLNDNSIKEEQNSDIMSNKSQVDSSQNSTRKIEHEGENSDRDISGESKTQEKKRFPEKVPQKEREIAGNDPWKRGDDSNFTNRNKTGADTFTTKPGRLQVQDNKSVPETVLYSPKPGYNPFLDEESERLNSKPKSENYTSEKTKSGDENSKDVRSVTEKPEKPQSLNPFDDDYVDDSVSDNADTASTIKSKSLNPFDDDYEEPFETDLDEVTGAKNVGVSDEGLVINSVDRNTGTSNVNTKPPNRGLETSADKTLQVSTDIDDVVAGNTSLKTDSNRLETTIDNRPESHVSIEGENTRKSDGNNTSPGRNSTIPTTDNSNVRPVSVRQTGNAQITQMHRKEPRRPTALNSKPPVRKQLTESRIKLKRPESENLGGKGTPTTPSPARGQLSLPSSPRSRLPSFEEWKANKSNEAAKQEEIKAKARQMIKEVRAKSVKTQNPSSTGKETPHKTATSGIPVPASASLPRLETSKKYKAPEPPGATKQGSLASKLKDEIEYQKKITEKTRKTLESSRVKRINPKQESVPEVEKRSERSEKVQQAIREAMEKPNRKTNPPDTATNLEADDVNKDTADTISPPKPPRVYTYTEEAGTESQGGSQEPETEPEVGSTNTGEETEVGNKPQDTQAEIENEPNSSLQQNPFKLTLKKKESVPQAVVKPLPSTADRETKIDLKKYSVRSRKFSEPLADSGLSRRFDQTQSSQESLSDNGHSSEEDVNDILDNVGDASDNENKTDDELYNNGEDEEGFQDTSQYVEHEIAVLEEDRIALDRVAVKLEKELREAMNTADCKEEEQRLFQEWFLLVNKRNEIVRRQTELSILEKEENLEKRFELLNRELRFLMADKNREKTAQEKKREELLLAELVRLVNKRDELVRIEDSQVQEAEKAEQHIEHVVRNTRIPKKQGDCCIQ